MGRVEVGLDGAVFVDVGRRPVHDAHLRLLSDVLGDSEADGSRVEVAREGFRGQDRLACRRVSIDLNLKYDSLTDEKVE